MEWLFIAAVSIGLPLAVPPMLRARSTELIDEQADREADERTDRATRRRRRTAWSNEAFAGFGLVAAGLIGLTLVGFDTSTAITLIAAATLGVAAGVIHPDALDWLTPRPTTRAGDGSESG